MDAITLLKNDHKTVEQLFKRFEKAGDRAHAEKRKVVDRIIEELSIHASVEELIFYPVTRAAVPAVEDVALESLEEHHIVKWVLSELEKMDPKDERFDAKVTVLIENVRHHVEEEEEEYFPKVREALGRNALNDVGDAMVEAKKTAPTHPHPRSPDEFPANAVAGALGAVDRVGDVAKGVAQGGVAAVQDLIERITGTDIRTPAAKGNSVARKAATTTRRRAAKVVDRVESETKRARATGKATVTSARRNAKRTASTAKTAAGTKR